MGLNVELNGLKDGSGSRLWERFVLPMQFHVRIYGQHVEFHPYKHVYHYIYIHMDVRWRLEVHLLYYNYYYFGALFYITFQTSTSKKGQTHLILVMMRIYIYIHLLSPFTYPIYQPVPLINLT